MNKLKADEQYKKVSEFIEYCVNAFNLGLPEDKKLNVVTFMGDVDILITYSIYASLKRHKLLDNEHLSYLDSFTTYSSLSKRYDMANINIDDMYSEILYSSERLLEVISILNYQVQSHVLFDNLSLGLSDLFDFILFDKVVRFDYSFTPLFKALSLGNELTKELEKMFSNNEVNLSKYRENIHNKLSNLLDE